MYRPLGQLEQSSTPISDILFSPFQQMERGYATLETLLGNPAYSALPSVTQQTLATNLTNSATGTLTPDQKAALENTEAQELLQAGSSPAQAASQAQSDITEVLTAAGADPSQNPIGGVPWWLIGGAAGIVLLALFLK